MRSAVGFAKLIEIRLVIIEVGEVVWRMGFDEQLLLSHAIDEIHLDWGARILTGIFISDEMECTSFSMDFLDPLKNLEKNVGTRLRVYRIPNHSRRRGNRYGMVKSPPSRTDPDPTKSDGK